jgi:hypothetical protein
MSLRILRTFLLLSLAATVSAQSSPTSTNQSVSPSIAGVWVLNPSLTQRPDEIGFSPGWGAAGGETGGRSGGGRGRRGGSGSSGGAASFPQASRESIDDATRMQQLTGEARTPPAHLTIVQQAGSVSIVDDQGHSRTFHPDGTLDQLTIGTVSLPTTARWDAGSLVIVFDIESGRQLRYTFTPSANPARLLVDIRFIERGHEGDEVRLTYEAPDEHNRALLSGAAPASPAPPATPAAAPPAASGVMPPSARPPVLPPGSELRGLTTIGTTVEDLGAQAVACGLDQAKIKTSIARILADAGFKTQPDHNEETYVLVSIVTSKLQDGVCVSRYDASLVSQGDATFPYLKGLVAVEVPLLRQGGMAGGSPAAHASAVMEAIAKAVNSFVSQIRATNK